MCIRFSKIRVFVSCVAISLFLHFCAFYLPMLFGHYDFGAAVGDPPGVMVDLAASYPGMPASLQKSSTDAPQPEEEENVDGESDSPLDSSRPVAASVEKAVAPSGLPASPEPPATPAPVPEPAAPTTATAPPAAPPVADAEPPRAEPYASSRPEPSEGGPAHGHAAAPPGKNGIFTGKREKLTYSVTMMGMPIGSAELEARNENAVTTITLKVQSNAAVASIYPVFDYIETQHIDGKYLLTKIRQQEGSFRSDEAFTINLQKKRVSLSDNIRYRNLKLTVPSDDVLDTLSGIYSLRKRELQVGRTETLHIFDSETYAEVPVEVLRREEIRLPNAKKVAALVVRPLQKTAGIFRRTGDVLIWMTDDASKVPVRIVTTIALGKVTADLVSAERDEHDAEDGKEKVAAGW